MLAQVALIACLVGCSAAAAAGSVLIVADEWPQMDVLAHYLEAEGGYAVEKAEQDQLPEDLAPYHAVFQFIHGRFDDDPAQALMDYATGGGRLVVLHHGVSSAKRATQGWLEFLGVALERDKDADDRYVWFEGVDLTLVNLNPRHYITAHNVAYDKTLEYRSSDRPSPSVSLPAFDLEQTEVYLNHQFTDAREKTVLLGFRYEDRETGEVHMQDRAGWFKAVGKGLVFYFQPGHAASDFENASFCQILLNCLTWRVTGAGLRSDE